jgi:hypothetical protein
MYRYVESGSMPHQKIGTNIRMTQNDIDTFLAGRNMPKTRQNTFPPTIEEMRTCYRQLTNNYQGAY